MFPVTVPTIIDQLVGRDREVDAALDLFQRGTRVVTITGPGGVGKTRTALEVGSRLGSSMPGRVAFIALAAVREPGLVMDAVADAIGVRLSADQPAVDSVVAGLADDPALLVLDNVEHVATCRDEIEQLVDRCPALRLLATSRIGLGIAGEQSFRLAPLGVDDALALLTQAAGRVVRGFVVDATNDQPLRSVCRRLDGLPLAIELAATRLRVLSARELAAALDDGFDVLRTADGSGAPHHHRALTAAIDWSYRLLDDAGRRLLRSLSVLAGSFERDAVAAVAGLDAVEALDGIDQLLGHHLLVAADDSAGNRRFDTFASIREFASSRLTESGDEAEVRARAERWALDLVTDTSSRLTGPDQQRALAVVDEELDNLRAILAWSVEPRSDEVGLRLVGGLWRYWWMRGRLAEGQAWSERVLGAYRGPDSPQLADALRATGQLVLQVPRPVESRGYLERALDLFERFGDDLGMAECWNTLGLFVHFDSDVARSESLHRAALDVYRRHDRPREVAVALNGLSGAAHLRGDFDEALRLGRETIDVLRETGDLRSVAVMVSVVAEHTLMLADATEAIALYEEGLALAIELGDRWAIGQALARLGRALVCAGRLEKGVAVLREAEGVAGEVGDDIAAAMVALWRGRAAELEGDLATAGACSLDALRRSLGMNHAAGVRATLQHLATLAETVGDRVAAVQLTAACGELHGESGSETFGVEGRFIPAISAAIAAAFDDAQLADLRKAAAGWSADQAVIAATGVVAGLPRRAPSFAVDRDVAGTLGLTARERDLIGPLLDRQTDKEIAADLGISVRTVTTHVSSILRKLDVPSRRDVADAARRLGLVGGRSGENT